MDFRILGPFEVVVSSENIAPMAPKPRQVIALLTLRRNSVVQASELIDELWEEHPPVSAMTTLQTYIYKLRKTFKKCGAAEILQTRPTGYMLSVPDEKVDLYWFERAMNEGRTTLDRGDPLRAAQILADALAMWRGPALADVIRGNLLSAYVTRLEEVRFRTLELRIDTDLSLGRHRELISELKSLVIRYPLHEGFHMSLMTALERSGRRYEALDVYRRLRSNLVEELGLEPSREVQQLHQALLSSEAPVTSGVAAEARLTYSADEVWEEGPVSVHLPSDIPDFVGRGMELGKICRQMAGPSHGSRGAGQTAVISGMPGVGKTALAVHAAHRVRSSFGDGHLYADLRGSTTTARDPAEVTRSFLRALGVAESEIPDGLESRSTLLRSVVASRRILMVLDDAASLAQVRPLLPGDGNCAVIITSRRKLEGLDGAWNLVVDVLGRSDSIELLARIIGRTRTHRERDAAEMLVDACDDLPLALRSIGCRLAAMPGYALSRMVDKLTHSRQRLEELRFGDLDLRSRLDSSYERLEDQERGVFALLSTLPSEFTADAAADSLGLEVSEASRMLERFFSLHLLRCIRDDGSVRYAFPKLTRIYARERLTTTLFQAQYNEPEAPISAPVAR